MAIVLKNVSKSFGDKNVIDNFSHSFEDGKWTLITGASGCGKTTLFRLILGLEKMDAGEMQGISEKFSVVFQENRLCEEFTIIDNLQMVWRNNTFSQERAENALKELELYEDRDKKVSELSGGMKRRTAILRAVLVPSEVYLLDEPFYGLDQIIKEKTMDFLMQYLKGKTVIMITHDQEAISYLKEAGVIYSEVPMRMISPA